MKYALIENGAIAEYPVFEGDIRARYPNISFGAEFAPPSEYVAVADTPYPATDYTKNVEEGAPAETENGWVVTWLVTDATSEQLAERTAQQWSNVRAARNQRLVSCDWTQLPDAPLTAAQTADWAEYRQALRDVTTQPDPFNIVWPVKPS